MTITAPAPTTTFQGLPKVFWLLFSGQLVNRFGGVVLPFLVFYLTGRGYAAAQIAAVISAYGLGGLGGQPLGGYLADRFGRRVTLIGGLLATAACLILIAAAGSLAWLMAAAVAMGLAATSTGRPPRLWSPRPHRRTCARRPSGSCTGRSTWAPPRPAPSPDCCSPTASGSWSSWT